MVKCGVLFEVRTGFLSKMQASFVFKGLIFIVSNLVPSISKRRLRGEEV
jgi:hypothetical protein